MNGQIRTLNKKGFDLGKPSYRIQDWIDAYDGRLPLLDMGCGLGTNAIEAARRGCRVVAMDCSEDHLARVREKAGDIFELRGRLSTAFGELPHRASLPPDSVSGILCAQVVHFLKPSAVKESLSLFYKWLAPGGKLVLLACSHYSGFNLKSGLVRDIEEEIEREGPENVDSWPGFIGDGKQSPIIESWRPMVPVGEECALPGKGDCFHTFSDRQLGALARHAGFQVLSTELCDGELSNYPAWIKGEADEVEEALRHLVGKDQAVLVAVKPIMSESMSVSPRA